MCYVLRFGDEECRSRQLAGGKGATLAELTQAGFPVPAGFCVTTSAYSDFIRASGLAEPLSSQAAAVVTDDAVTLAEQTAQIRQMIRDAALPDALSRAIDLAYEELVPGGYVAVRSSGTAEDLAEESFAGLHDTFLHISGTDRVLDAIKECWASLWTARAAAYRHDNGFNHTQVAIAVVVQQMIESEASGVLFTGQPVTTATDQTVINASWGLGEAIVQGIIVPDEYVIESRSGRILERTLGSKALQIVRDPLSGHGTAAEAVPEARRRQFTLSDSQAAALAVLGQRAQDYYGGFPQDIEWALGAGKLWLLQSRRITGVEFSWDAEINEDPEFTVADDTVWTRGFADEVYTGVITPLNHTLRWASANRRVRWGAGVCGFADLYGVRSFEYHKACVYANADFERRWLERTTLPFLRPYLLGLIPRAWQSDVDQWEPLHWPSYLLMLAKIAVRAPRNLRLRKTLDLWRGPRRREKVAGLTIQEVRRLGDEELIAYVEGRQQTAFEFTCDGAFQFQVFFRQGRALLAWIFEHWYDGGDPSLQTDLLSGAKSRTDTQIENLRLWELATRVRDSARLRALLEQHEDGAFFSAVAASSDREVRAFAEAYADFLHDYGFRGQADRDLIYPRRSEDPSIDYRVLRMLSTVEAPIHPEQMEQETNRRREAAYRHVAANLRRGGPRGLARVAIFRLLFRYLEHFIVYRDNGRFLPTDQNTMFLKLGIIEMGRRLQERSSLDAADDVYYLTWSQACALLRGRSARTGLLDAKVAARRRDVSRILAKELTPPMFLQRGRVIDLDRSNVSLGAGVFEGTPTSKGTVTGTARVIRFLTEIGRVRPGEVLVTNSTDPGWTPVFLLLSGIVVETGGVLSHASCLAREYGFPAVQLARGTELIPDGATITVNGDSGIVTLVSDPSGAGAEPSRLVNA
jgi:rifampicin phosphotransferase